MKVLDGKVTNEKVRGFFTSIVASIIVYFFNFLLVVFGSSPELVNVILIPLGGVLSYMLDIVFARKGPIPYTDLTARYNWLLVSFRKRYFFRFIVTLIIELIVTLSLVTAIRKAMDSRGHMVSGKWKTFRDFMITVVCSLLVFTFFGNILRFDWAYSDDNIRILNISVLLCLVICVTIFTNTYSLS